MNITRSMKHFPLWIYLFLLGSVIFYTYRITIASDMGWYMNSALNLYNGNGYKDMAGALITDRGPIFPLLISGSYILLGVSAWSAFWVVRIFAVLNPVIIYFLGKKLFGKWVGFAAALLALSSYSLNYWSYRHLDGVWPFFAILSIALLYEALEKEYHLLFLLSGLLMGLSYLVKQTAILLWPLPLILLVTVANYRSKRCAVGSGIYFLALGVVISPWLGYVYLNDGKIISAFLGPGSDMAVAQTFTAEFIRNYFTGLLDYYSADSQSLSVNFTLAPLFVCSWIYTAYRGIRGEKESILLSATLLLLSPYIAHVGHNNLRVGQLVIFLLITYLVTARFCWYVSLKVSEGIKRKSMSRRAVGGYVCALAITMLVIIQTTVPSKRGKGIITLIKGNYFYNSLVRGETVRKISGMFGEDSRECGDWIRKHLPEDSRLLVSKPVEGKPVYFYSHGKCPVFVMPVIQSNKIPQRIAKKNDESIIFLSAWTARLDPRNKLFLLTEDDLLMCIKEKKIDYVVVHRMRNYLSKYFDRSDSYSKLIEFGRGAIRVYKVKEARPTVEPTMMISQNLIIYLKNLMNNDSEKFVWYVNEFFEPLLNWNSEKVKELLQLNNDGILQNAVIVRENKIYHSL